MRPANSSIIFNQEQYQIDEVLRFLRRDHFLSMLISRTKQVKLAKSTHNLVEQYDGHYITISDRTILAMAGPANDMQLNTLFHVFNSQVKIIKSVIVLLKNEDSSQKYCANYFHKGYEVHCRDFDLSIEQISVHGEKTLTHKVVDYENRCVNTLFRITAKRSQIYTPLKISALPLASGETILKNELPENNENCVKNTQYIRFLLEHFNEWFEHKIVAIHCEFGAKRTAVLVIAFFLVAEFDNIFIANDPQQTTKNIFQLCQNILHQRETFNPDAVEIYSAIKLAFKLKVAREYFLQCNQSVRDDHLLSPEGSADINKPADNKLNPALSGQQQSKPVYQNENTPSKDLANQMHRLSIWESSNGNSQTELKKPAEQNTAQPHKDKNPVLTIKLA